MNDPKPRGGNGEPTHAEEMVGDDRLIATIQERMERRLGPIQAVWCRPRVDDRVHVDIHWIPPTPEHPWHWILTTGMSELPMAAPAGMEECRFAEVYLCLPPDWPMAMKMPLRGEAGWPLRVLSDLAQYPHQTGRWIWYAHTYAQLPMENVAPGVPFSSVVLGPSISMPRGFNGIQVDRDRIVWYFSVLPLHAEERAFALSNSASALLGRFERSGITDVVDPRRPSVVGDSAG